jgi:putative hemolysin
VRRPHLFEQLQDMGRRGRVAVSIRERSQHYLAAIQVMEFLVVFAFSAVAAAFVAPRLSEILSFVGVNAVVGDVSAVVITVVSLSVFAMLFGLFVPRAIGARYATGVLVALVVPIELVSWLTRPVVFVLVGLTRILTRPFGGLVQTTAVSEDEIRALVETGEEQGVLHAQERNMIQGIFDLGDKHVHDVMTPRPDIHAVDVDTPGDHVLEQVVAIGHSRVPVFEGSPDQIIGIVYLRDLFRRLARGEKDFGLRQYVRPAHFVPETKRVDELLREMQQHKLQMAIVVDEYGGTAGLVTIEDLVEEIVGEIRDEYEADQELVIPVSEREVLMDGRVPFDEIIDAFELDIAPSEDYDTLAGFIVHELGRLPRQGEEVRCGSVRFVVEAVEARRVRRVRITREAPEPVAEPVEG